MTLIVVADPAVLASGAWSVHRAHFGPRDGGGEAAPAARLRSAAAAPRRQLFAAPRRRPLRPQHDPRAAADGQAQGADLLRVVAVHLRRVRSRRVRASLRHVSTPSS